MLVLERRDVGRVEVPGELTGEVRIGVPRWWVAVHRDVDVVERLDRDVETAGAGQPRSDATLHRTGTGTGTGTVCLGY